MAKRDKFESDIIDVLRQENKDLTTKINSLRSQLSTLENNRLKYEQRSITAEDGQSVLFDAVRILADAINNDTASGRAARTRARKILEDSQITPPGTLGFSRARKKRRKRKS